MDAPKFRIGQKVVALKNICNTFGKVAIRKGTITTVLKTRPSSCKCPGWDIYTGIQDYGFDSCEKCGYAAKVPDYDWWFSQNSFAPVETIELGCSIEQILEEIGVHEEALSELEVKQLT